MSEDNFDCESLIDFLQFDAFIKAFSDPCFDDPYSDEDGDSLYRLVTKDLLFNSDIRISIRSKVNREDALRVMRKIVAWIERDFPASDEDLLNAALKMQLHKKNSIN